MTEHTPGPWIAEEDEYSICYRIVASGEDIAEAYWLDLNPEGFGKANARLIAAAPDLLKACLNATVDPSKPLRNWQLQMISAAIAKARGTKD